MISENLFYIKSISDSEKVHTSRFQFMFWKYFAENEKITDTVLIVNVNKL